jgi:hypothetical protein
MCKVTEVHPYIMSRETMEQNEQVIFKVYEEKERVWEKEIR